MKEIISSRAVRSAILIIRCPPLPPPPLPLAFSCCIGSQYIASCFEWGGGGGGEIHILVIISVYPHPKTMGVPTTFENDCAPNRLQV